MKDVQDVDEFFPRDIPELLAKYPITDDINKETVENNKDYIYATILLRLSEDIIDLQNHSSESKKQTEALDRFGKEIGLNIKNCKVPKFNMEDVQLRCTAGSPGFNRKIGQRLHGKVQSCEHTA